tara:strand:+ start:1248 stop:1604 length:357 start_codon:yes stop_codon:yes gene_type:complete
MSDNLNNVQMYGPSGSVKPQQFPNRTATGVHRFSHAVCPAVKTPTKRPTYVMINNSGSYTFSYEDWNPGDTPTVSSYITASVSEADSPYRLDISPSAWDKADSAGAVGNVTFVYVRVR